MLRFISRPGKLMAASSDTICVAHLLFGDGVWGVENYVHNLLLSPKADVVKPLIICSGEGPITQKFIGSKFEIKVIPCKGILT